MTLTHLIMPPKPISDVLVIGAGPAGKSCAAALARLRHIAIVFSNKKFRNEKSTHMHTVSTWDHRDPSDFRAASREDILARYKTIGFEDVGIQNVEKVSKDGDGRRVVFSRQSMIPEKIGGEENLFLLLV